MRIEIMFIIYDVMTNDISYLRFMHSQSHTQDEKHCITRYMVIRDFQMDQYHLMLKDDHTRPYIWLQKNVMNFPGGSAISCLHMTSCRK